MLDKDLNRAIGKVKKIFCSKCKSLKKGKDCAFFEMCVVSVHSFKKPKPLHYGPVTK